MWTRINSNSGRFCVLFDQVLKKDDKHYIPTSEQLDNVRLPDEDPLEAMELLSGITFVVSVLTYITFTLE